MARIPLPTVVLSIAILILSLSSVDSCGRVSDGDFGSGDIEQTMDNNACHIYQAFHEYGLTDEQIAGMLSNLQAENGIDPTAVDRQGPDVGHQYRAGIYYTDPKDGETAKAALTALSLPKPRTTPPSAARWSRC